ncbi:uncharacterized protein [Halyomorpha halys]|uniref:uncharacterized protein n=1 Tax=Halyomorpha halys TaxID=286706 RepID=UPI0006D52536|nr:uncharacterized protein LOC106682548 [Halyomorpha halys]XP_014278949.1 uncharacterized protein LOC106682548 [Halyomorpha halys]
MISRIKQMCEPPEAQQSSDLDKVLLENEKEVSKTKEEDEKEPRLREGIDCLKDITVTVSMQLFRKSGRKADNHPEEYSSYLKKPNPFTSIQDISNIFSTAKRTSSRENWKRSISKQLRNSGEAYETYSKNKKIRKCREIKAPCGEKCKLKCSAQINEKERQEIFSAYWSLGNIEKQREFINNSMTRIEPKYRYIRVTDSRNPRQRNNAYYFTREGKKVRVCKLFFENTLDINDRTIRTVQEKRDKSLGATIEPDLRGKHGKQKTLGPAIRQEIHKHINSIPKIENHYTFENPSRTFIDGSRSLADIHRDYVSSCKAKNIPYGSYALFRRVFMNDFNISFFVSEKGICEICVKEKGDLKE